MLPAATPPTARSSRYDAEPTCRPPSSPSGVTSLLDATTVAMGGDGLVIGYFETFLTVRAILWR